MDRGTALLRYPRSVTQVYSEKGQPEVSQDTAAAGRHSLVKHRSSGGRVNSAS